MTSGPTTGAASGATDAAPVCPRHPGTVSYVRCQRCERPACPACQRPAAVGVHCVDCVRAAARTTPTSRTALGGRAGGSRPVVTQVVMALCIAAFAAQWGPWNVTERLAFAPVEALAEPYRFLTAAFLHSPDFVLHIVANLYALWIVGPYLESLLGRARFAALYLISALGGSVGILLLASPDGPAWNTASLGASGAVFGLFSAVLVVNRRMRRDTSRMIGVILVNLVIGFWPGLNISWQGHLGGLVTGLVSSLALVLPLSAPPAARGRLQVAGLALVVLLLVALTAIKIATVPAGSFA